MKKLVVLSLCFLIHFTLNAQNNLSPELLWELGRISPMGISKDGKSVVFSVKHYQALEEKSERKYYSKSLKKGEAKEISAEEANRITHNSNVSPDGKYELFTKSVKINKITAQDHYPELKNANVYIYDDLHYRHWDHWTNGEFSHLFIKGLKVKMQAIDLMKDEPYHCPQMPFGGDEDFCWSSDSKKVVYVAKKKFGTDYAVSTNTDLYEYNLETKKTVNLTEGMMGYDTHPLFSSDGTLAWLSMKRDGYEADKNDIYVLIDGKKVNLTARWDETVYGFQWSKDGEKIYFNAPFAGTIQLFELTIPQAGQNHVNIRQITDGVYNVYPVEQIDNKRYLVARTDMNHAKELYILELANGEMEQFSHVNDEIYRKLGMSKIEKRMIKTTDGQDMLTWVIYPPNFDKNKKYPTLLYCQGGPQSALSQFYSFRWNFQLMAAQGYIIVAPNRRGMPGHGVRWNEDISKDWAGQCMQDYLSAIDALAKESFVDENRLGCIGASFGGFSAFYLAGHHEGRFKSFIAHDGLFNLRSFYGTTEELFFANWDIGGPYWDKENKAAQKSYEDFSPINFVDNWDTPILIIQGGKDFRVPIGQGLEAFQAAQLKGLKSRLLYFPDENHWVLNPQNALVWQREFYRWLKETL
jgi:dipeptidyl aminopeptidase/acylaminoacyl peptidase